MSVIYIFVEACEVNCAKILTKGGGEGESTYSFATLHDAFCLVCVARRLLAQPDRHSYTTLGIGKSVLYGVAPQFRAHPQKIQKKDILCRKQHRNCAD